MAKKKSTATKSAGSTRTKAAGTKSTKAKSSSTKKATTKVKATRTKAAKSKTTIPQLEDYQWDAYSCCGCKGCVWVDHVYCSGVKYGMRCPSIHEYDLDTYSAIGRNKLALGLLDGTFDFNNTALDIIYKCCLCGACDIGCKRNLDLDPGMVLETLRIRAVEKGKGPLPAHKKVTDKIARTGNRYGASASTRPNWLPKNIKTSARPQMLYFVGCNSSYKDKNIALATAGILDAAKVKWAPFPDEACCGHPYYEVGMAEEALKQAKGNIDALKKSGARTIVTSCAECYKTWKVDYPKLMDKPTEKMGYNVIHITELAAEKIAAGKLEPKYPIDLKVAYHDPCNLARLSDDWVPWHGTRGKWGVTEPPKQYRRGTNVPYQPARDILDAIPGLERTEFIRMKENTMCCGAGGGVAEAYPEFARNTADHRLEEAQDVGAEAVATACPYCNDNFSYVSADRGRDMKVFDVTELLYASLTGRGI
ncbi:MAG: (Fe-S)-binding protein [Dehalococcoidia bacterium]